MPVDTEIEFKFKPDYNSDGIDSPTNGDRAAWAEQAINQMPSRIFEHGTPEGIQDLITDLLHLCDREEFDVEEVLEFAKSNWEEER